MNKKLIKESLKRSKVPDCSSGPMSLAKEDRRILAAEVERLQKRVAELEQSLLTEMRLRELCVQAKRRTPAEAAVNVPIFKEEKR